MQLGIQCDATGVQRRVLSNIYMNIRKNIRINIDINPGINIQINRMPLGCHWELAEIPLGMPLGCKGTL